MKHSSNQSGYSLIEIISVLAITSILTLGIAQLLGLQADGVRKLNDRLSINDLFGNVVNSSLNDEICKNNLLGRTLGTSVDYSTYTIPISELKISGDPSDNISQNDFINTSKTYYVDTMQFKDFVQRDDNQMSGSLLINIAANGDIIKSITLTNIMFATTFDPSSGYKIDQCFTEKVNRCRIVEVAPVNHAGALALCNPDESAVTGGGICKVYDGSKWVHSDQAWFHSNHKVVQGGTEGWFSDCCGVPSGGLCEHYWNSTKVLCCKR